MSLTPIPPTPAPVDLDALIERACDGPFHGSWTWGTQMIDGVKALVAEVRALRPQVEHERLHAELYHGALSRLATAHGCDDPEWDFNAVVDEAISERAAAESAALDARRERNALKADRSDIIAKAARVLLATEAERDALRADVARVTGERDEANLAADAERRDNAEITKDLAAIREVAQHHKEGRRLDALSRIDGEVQAHLATKMRLERDAAIARADKAAEVASRLVSESAREAQTAIARAEAAEKERTRLGELECAQSVALEDTSALLEASLAREAQTRAREGVLREALVEAIRDLETCASLRGTAHWRDDAYEPVLENLLRGVGYGASMHSLARLWFRRQESGAFTVGPCLGTVEATLKKVRAALAATPADAPRGFCECLHRSSWHVSGGRCAVSGDAVVGHGQCSCVAFVAAADQAAAERALSLRLAALAPTGTGESAGICPECHAPLSGDTVKVSDAETLHHACWERRLIARGAVCVDPPAPDGAPEGRGGS